MHSYAVSLDDTTFYPPLVLLRSLEDKKMLKFYSLIVIIFTLNVGSWLPFHCRDAAQPSSHAVGGKQTHPLFWHHNFQVLF